MAEDPGNFDSTLHWSPSDEPQSLAYWKCGKCGRDVVMSSGQCPKDGAPRPEPSDGADKLLGDRFEIISKIGAGGMSVIYKARQPLLNKFVAIKMLHSHLLNAQTMLRFQ